MAKVNKVTSAKQATAIAVLNSLPFCWITKPFDVVESSIPRIVVVDSTGILGRFSGDYNG